MKRSRMKPEAFEKIGHDTMLETGDEQIAGPICGQRIEAYAHGIEDDLVGINSCIEDASAKSNALWTVLYDRSIPVSDSTMLAHSIRAWVMFVAFLVCAAASAGLNAWTLVLWGWPVAACCVAGLLFTGFFVAVTYLLFEHLAAWGVGLAVMLVVSGLCVWGALDYANARGMMLAHRAEAEQAGAGQSFVDNSGTELQSTTSLNQDAPSEAEINARMGDAAFKFAIASDLMVGLLLALLLKILADPDYAAWREMKQLNRAVRELEKAKKHLEMMPIIARKLCLAGMLAAKAKLNKRPPSYHRRLQVMMIALLALATRTFPAQAQTFDRMEAILIDVSGSIAKGSSSEAFREYLTGARQLLLREPPKSRVYVSVITTDSFGSVQPLLIGWTPEIKGVFTDDLNRARRELASTFEARAAKLRPISSGTDIFGGLWHIQALIGSTDSREREIWIFSDMMNETASFNMPALLALGPEKMLEMARSNNLVVPLNGYRIHVLGASLTGLTPQAWNTIKSFWILYFRAAGAEVIEYSPECGLKISDAIAFLH